MKTCRSLIVLHSTECLYLQRPAYPYMSSPSKLPFPWNLRISGLYTCIIGPIQEYIPNGNTASRRVQPFCTLTDAPNTCRARNATCASCCSNGPHLGTTCRRRGRARFECKEQKNYGPRCGEISTKSRFQYATRPRIKRVLCLGVCCRSTR